MRDAVTVSDDVVKRDAVGDGDRDPKVELSLSVAVFVALELVDTVADNVA